jgi:hypothetical protein
MMRKVTSGLLTIAALAVALPAMAQSTSPGFAATSPGQSQVPQPPDDSVNWKGVGVGAGTVAGNILYVPAKLVYGILGGITGAATYALTGGNTQTANTVWRSSLGGDYVLTPDMVSGKEPIHFSGPTTTPPPSSMSTSPTAIGAGKSAMTTPSEPTTTASAGSMPNDFAGTSSGSASAGAAAKGAATSSGVAQPGDRGTGPVSGQGSAAGASSSSNQETPAPPLPTTIE